MTSQAENSWGRGSRKLDSIIGHRRRCPHIPVAPFAFSRSSSLCGRHQSRDSAATKLEPGFSRERFLAVGVGGSWSVVRQQCKADGFSSPFRAGLRDAVAVEDCHGEAGIGRIDLDACLVQLGATVAPLEVNQHAGAAHQECVDGSVLHFLTTVACSQRSARSIRERARNHTETPRLGTMAAQL